MGERCRQLHRQLLLPWTATDVRSPLRYPQIPARVMLRCLPMAPVLCAAHFNCFPTWMPVTRSALLVHCASTCLRTHPCLSLTECTLSVTALVAGPSAALMAMSATLRTSTVGKREGALPPPSETPRFTCLVQAGSVYVDSPSLSSCLAVPSVQVRA